MSHQWVRKLSLIAAVCVMFLHARAADADTGLTVSLVPVEAHVKPGDINSTSVGTIVRNEITLGKGGANVWLEVRVSNWNPDGTGPGLLAWGIDLDKAGFTTGALTVKEDIACTTNAECEAALGPGAFCGLPPDAPVRCATGYIDKYDPVTVTGRRDYISPGDIGGFDRIDYRFGGIMTNCPPACAAPGKTCVHPVTGPTGVPCVTLPDCDFLAGETCTGPFPPGGMYAGTMIVDVPPDAKGTFTIGFSFIEFVDENLAIMPSVATFPAKITVADVAPDAVRRLRP